MSVQKYIKLNNGVEMPMVGIGTFLLTPDEMAEIAALNQNKRYYVSTPDKLKAYAEMVPPVDEQK